MTGYPRSCFLCRASALKAFTLSELLIGLLILAVIASFSIPKILNSSRKDQQKAAAKEVAAMISAAYFQHRNNGLVTTATKPSDLMQYMQYTQTDTSSVIDDTVGASSDMCMNSTPCVRLHNGGLLEFRDDGPFGVLNSTQVVRFLYDPDGVFVGGTGDHISKGLIFLLFSNGRVVTYQNMPTGTTWNGSTMGAGVDPSWFDWN
jgi:prepilin-type N-terminal cleavage/methylation domain-containing protein